MAFNGSGVFVRLYNWVNDAAAAINITASRMDADTQDIANGLSACLTRDGQGKPSAAIDWNGQNLTNVANFANTGNTTLGNATADTLDVGNGSLVKNAFSEFGINCTPVSGVQLRIQSAGNNDVGWEWQRASATKGLMVSYDRTGMAFKTQAFSAADYEIQLSGVARWTIDSSASLLPVSTNANFIGSSGLRLQGLYSVLGDFSGAVTAASLVASGNISAANVLSGTYTPAFTTSTNVTAAVVVGTWKYIRVGSNVMVSGLVTVTATTAAGASSAFFVSLPIASTLGTLSSLAGSGTRGSGGANNLEALTVFGDTGGNRALVGFNCFATGATQACVQFQYIII